MLTRCASLLDSCCDMLSTGMPVHADTILSMSDVLTTANGGKTEPLWKGAPAHCLGRWKQHIRVRRHDREVETAQKSEKTGTETNIQKAGC